MRKPEKPKKGEEMSKKINITKEEIEEFYIKENHSRSETAEHFGIKEDTLKYCLKKFGIPPKDKKLVVKITKDSFLDRYGVDSYFKTTECKEKLKKLNDSLGVAHYSQSKECKDKMRKTCEKKYGGFYVNTPEFKQKSKETCLKKYGVEFSTQDASIKEKAKNTLTMRYGVGNFNQKSIKHLEIWNSEDKMEVFLSSLSEKPTLSDIAGYFNVDDSAFGVKYGKKFYQYIDLHPKRSKYEDEIKTFLNSIGIENIVENDHSILEGKEIDLFLPDQAFGVEFDGDYWHSDIFKDDHGGRSTYHQEKSLLAEEKGIFLFNIYEHEWTDLKTRENIKDRLKSLLMKNQNKIAARKCAIKALSPNEKREFLELNHIQGNCGSTVNYGLEYQGEIVACMSFSHPKNKKYDWELSRYCTKHGTTVQGGASKLLKFFIRNNTSSGNTISSYNDITKTKGDLYKKLGFDCVSVNSPNYIWYNFKTKDIRTRYQEQKGGEVERMHALGYHRVCDCGTKTWVYTVK